MNNLATLRKKYNMTQTDVAKALNLPGIDTAMISRFESGVCLPNSATKTIFANLFHCSIEDLCLEDSESATEQKLNEILSKLNQLLEREIHEKHIG